MTTRKRQIKSRTKTTKGALRIILRKFCLPGSRSTKSIDDSPGKCQLRNSSPQAKETASLRRCWNISDLRFQIPAKLSSRHRPPTIRLPIYRRIITDRKGPTLRTSTEATCNDFKICTAARLELLTFSITNLMKLATRMYSFLPESTTTRCSR